MFTVRGLKYRYPGAAPLSRPVLDIDELIIRPGERVAVLAYSGHGKTTLLNVLGAIDRSRDTRAEAVRYTDAGGVEHDLLGPLDRALWGREFGFVFQDPHLLPFLSARDNIAGRVVETGGSAADARTAADEWLARVEMTAYAGQKPRFLSGGQRQRVAVSRAVVHRPRVVFADEPTANLDPVTGKTTLDALDAFVVRSGATLLLVTHNFEEALAVCDRFLLLSEGRIVADLRNDDGRLTAAALVGHLSRPAEPGAAEPGHRDAPLVAIEGAPPTAARESIRVARNWNRSRLLWRVRNVVRDMTDGRTRGFAWSGALVAAVTAFALTTLWGVRAGTVETLTAAVQNDPAFRRIEVSPAGGPALAPDQVDALRSIPNARVELFRLMAVQVLPDVGTLPRFMVLGPKDPLLREFSAGLVGDGNDPFGVVVSDGQAVRLGLLAAPLPPDAAPLAWANEPGRRWHITVRTRDRNAPVPVLAVVPTRQLAAAANGRDGLLSRRTAWVLDHWQAGWEHVLDTPNGEKLTPPALLVSTQRFRFVGDPLDWNSNRDTSSVVTLSDAIAAQGFVPVYAPFPSAQRAEGIELSWTRVDRSGRQMPVLRNPTDHQRFSGELVEAFREAGVRLEPTESPRLTSPAVEPVSYPPTADDEQAGQGAVYVDDFWQIPGVLESIRRLNVRASNSVEGAVALLRAADRLLRAACWFALLTLAVTGAVAVGGAGYALVQNGRGEIGIALANGTRPAQIVGHYLAVAATITLCGGVLGAAGAFAFGVLSRDWLLGVSGQIGVSLRFTFDWLAVGAIHLGLLLIAGLSVVVPAARVATTAPARLLRLRDR